MIICEPEGSVWGECLDVLRYFLNSPARVKEDVINVRSGGAHNLVSVARVPGAGHLVRESVYLWTIFAHFCPISRLCKPILLGWLTKYMALLLSCRRNREMGDPLRNYKETVIIYFY